jgi:hypothetical protein
MNSHYGERENLPFDLRHKAGPITFDLSPTATNAEIEVAKGALAKTLSKALKECIEAAGTTEKEPPIRSVPAKGSPAKYFDSGEVLATVGEPKLDEIAFIYEKEPTLYLRLIPVSGLERPLSPARLLEIVTPNSLGPLWVRAGGLPARNKHGVIVFEPRGHSRPTSGIKASTQVFPTGEIWGTNAWLLRYDEQAGQRVLPTLPFETTFFDTLRRYVKFAQDALGLKPPFEVRAGIVGIESGLLELLRNDLWGPIYQNEVTTSRVLNETSAGALNAFLLSFFDAVYELTSHRRPNGLYGFPPGPPRERW